MNRPIPISYTITLSLPGTKQSWQIKDCYFERRWAKVGRQVLGSIQAADKAAAFTLEDTKQKEALALVTEAAAIRLDQWVDAINNDHPSDDILDEIWEAGHDERQEIADRLADALDTVREGRS